jgi:hypothetical protein|uniref:Uncharacterized protein n=1 Tax=Picea sitchensis TaxID=3332 RepID=A9NNM9_PICSI|nr:unknown [Picea sitchensis]
MVFNTPIIVSVATWSASACQSLSCNPERLSSDHVLSLLCCLPYRQLGRLVVCVWSFFCVWHQEFFLDSDDDYSESDSESYHNDSHSD